MAATGKDVVIKTEDGKKLSGYLSMPANLAQGKAPGLVLIQEIFGVNHHIRSVCDKFANEGFIVLAPDIFWRIKEGIQIGYGPDDMQKGMGYYQQLDFTKVLQDIDDTISFLKAMPECSGKIGSVGFCLGGTLSYRAAANCVVDAAVCYYGGGIGQYLNEAEKITCPVTMHFGALDAHIPLTAVKAVEQALSGKPNTHVYVYDQADHGFNCDERSSYNKEAADLAFSRSLDCLQINCLQLNC